MSTRTELGPEVAALSAPDEPTWLEIDLAALRHNVSLLLSNCSPETKLIAVVKADAYGHGAVAVASAALSAGAWALAVARVREGMQLRAAGIRAPILVLGHATDQDLALALEADLAVTICGWRSALVLSALADSMGIRARVHLKVDTGMHRYGVVTEDAPRFAFTLRGLPGIMLEGVYTHYATADEPEGEAYLRQATRFLELVNELERQGLRPPLVHAANSAAALSGSEDCYDAIRPGLALYGAQPLIGRTAPLKPAMTVKARVARVLDVPRGEAVSYGETWVAPRQTRAAVVACGYADGYSRLLSNRGDVLIGGHRCRVLGRVCMDALVAGLPQGCEASVGDEAVLLGAQDAERVTAEELAERSGLSSYEVLCGMGRRSVRVYSG